jgi:hypothetical protein
MWHCWLTLTDGSYRTQKAPYATALGGREEVRWSDPMSTLIGLLYIGLGVSLILKGMVG